MLKKKDIADKLFFEKGCKTKEVFLRCQPDIATNTSWKTISKHVKMAIKSFVAPCIDKALLERICNFALQEKRTESEQDLLDCLRETVGYFTAFMMIKMQGWITDQGAMEPNGSGKTRPLDYKAQEKAKYALCDCGYDLLEELIFEKIIPNIGVFPKGKMMKPYSKFCTLLISSPEEFSQYQLLPGMGRLRHFIALMPFLNEAENDLKKCLNCEPFFCSLAEEFKKCPIDPKWAELRGSIQRFVAAKTMMYAAQRTALIWTTDGYKVLDRRPGSKGTNKGFNICNRQQFEETVSRYLTDVQQCLAINTTEECFELFYQCQNPGLNADSEESDSIGCDQGCSGCGQHRCPETCAPPEPQCITVGSCGNTISIL